MPVVRLAQLEIEPAQLEAYRAALREEIETSIAHEPGVQALYAVAEKDHPSRLHLMEIYADQAAYEAHVSSPHFLKYKAVTEDMVRSLQLIPATPVLLGAKAR